MQSNKLSQKQRHQSINYKRDSQVQQKPDPEPKVEPLPESTVNEPEQPEEKICVLDNPDQPIQQKKRGRKAKPQEEKLRGRWIKCQHCGECNYFNGQSDMKTTKEEKRRARKAQSSD